MSRTGLTPSQALGSLRDSTVRIVRHPANRGRRSRALGLYLTWQVWERVVRRPWTIRLGRSRRLRLHPHETVPALVLYCRIPDYEEMSFVRDYLRPGDLFVDVGANTGIYSLWASEVEGVDVLAFEPSTSAHARACENVALNRMERRIEVLRLALGASAARVRLTTGLGAMNHVSNGPGAAGQADEVVDQTTLDAALAGRAPALVKIDVEGAEIDVLRGGRETIGRHLPALLVEVNDPDGLDALLDELGYEAVRYDPASRRLAPAVLGLRANVLAVADVEQAGARLRSPGAARAPTYAEAPMTGAVSPPAPRHRLPFGLKAFAVQRIPLVRLALLHRDLLRESGWTRSGRGDAPVDRDGNPLPWYTYPAIHFLGSRIGPDMTVLEYGSGHSTLWWARRVAHVTAVESDAAWVARLAPSLPPNADLWHRPAGSSGRYAGAASEAGRRFDVVVIDGEDRNECARACLPALKDDGVIIWDNADWTALWADGLRHLEAHGFRQLELRGLGPLNWREWTTSVFYRPGANCLGL